ncbi:MAG: cupin domain-containing protein [Candidatus Hydrogenedentes bacterium]|nr:cupin domain-containing protein [Candidatus Hydrogenedentota bacterium]
MIREVDLTNATWYQGSRYSYPLRSEHTNGTLAIVDVYKRQGTEPPPHVHLREHEIFVILDGEIDLRAGADSFTAAPGGVAFLPRGIAHQFFLKQAWGHALIVAVPGGFDKYLVPFSEPCAHLDEPPLCDMPPDIPGLIARGREFGIEFVPPGMDLAAHPSKQPDGLIPFARARDEGELLNILGIPVRVKISTLESGGALSMFVTEDAPRMGPPLHVHHKEDETFYVLEGEYRVRAGDDAFTLKKGQMAFVPRGVQHCYANAGSSNGSLLVITTPGGFEEFFRDIDTLCREGTPSVDSLNAVGAKHRIDFVGPPIFT